LSTGVRNDYFSTFGDTVNPRAGLIYNPWAGSAFKLLYGSAFRAPNVYELYYNGPGSEPNPRLEPERDNTYQFVYEQELVKNLRWTTAVYRNDISDLIRLTTDPSNGNLVYENVGQATAKGVETGLDGTTKFGLRGRLSYAIQKTVDDTTGVELSNSPRHLAKFNLIVPIYRDRVFSGLEVQFSSGVSTLAGAQTSNYELVNWTLFTQRLAPGLEIAASLYNILNQKYLIPASTELPEDVIAQNGRAFGVKLTYHF
jgi:iron complex outermembrane receptor protein